MKKAKILVTISLFLTFSTALSVGAADFSKNRVFENNFNDIDNSAWYYSDVVNSYELSLINGKGNGVFDPNGTMSVAEAITLASRINIINSAKDALIQPEGGNWYDVYVEYAKAQGFLKETQFDSYTRPIKRSEMASLFAKALPTDALKAINTVTSIPDVKSNASFINELLTLYNAGIMMGSDNFGTFNSESFIKRSEVAAIISRIAISEKRLSKTLSKKFSGDSYTLVQNSDYTSNSGTGSGWNFDNRGGPSKDSESGPYYLADISEEYGTALIRDMSIISEGIVTLKTNINVTKGFNGISLGFKDTKGNYTYNLISVDNSFKLLQKDGTYKTIVENFGENRKLYFEVTLNFDLGTSTTSIDFVDYGTSEILSNDIKQYFLSTDDKNVLTIIPGTTLIYGNYSIFETFDFAHNGKFENGFTSTATESSTCEIKDSQVDFATSEKGGEVSLEKSFYPLSDNACFETLFIMPEYADTLTFALKSGDKDAITLFTNKGKLYANDKELRPYLANMWYTLRIEADLIKNEAIIKVCGKVCGKIPLNDVSSIDNIKISLKSEKKSAVSIDNLYVRSLKEYSNYIAPPIKPEGEENYNIGVNVCSLWRNDGTHSNWDCITPFDEIKPLIGYYDEGSPEVADWEIKWMAEHGIDFELFCWYASEKNKPMKTTDLSSAIHDGYFNAKYSNEVKFALLWEAANGYLPNSSLDFRNYYVPYFNEYFFKDERYMTIDNKLVMAIFGPYKLIEAMGGTKQLKVEFDYLRENAKTLGYDGMIILACTGASQELLDAGFDGISAYNWGKNGYEVDYTKTQINNNIKSNTLHVVPTVSSGFNNIGWNGTRSPNMSVSDWTLMHTWIRDEVLPTYKNKEKWTQNFVMLSTWNEYGEGTYIMPSGLNEFGYLDSLRDVYSKGGEHKDLTPTETQLSRITYLFPQYRSIIRPLQEKAKNGGSEYPDDILLELNFSNKTDFDKYEGWEVTLEKTPEGAYGKSVAPDTILMMKENLNLDISQVTYLKIRIKAPKDNFLELFFTTKDNPEWAQSRSLQERIVSDDFHDYYIKISSIPGWSGSLNKLRIDPVDGEGEFTISYVQFLYEKTVADIKINGITQKINNEITIDNNNTMISFNPDNAIHYLLNAYYEWDKNSKTLKIEANHNEVSFIMDENKAIINGKETPITCTPYLDDGLPVIPLQILCDALQYKYEIAEKQINIITNPANETDEIANRVKGEWDFNLDGDIEGWSPTQMSLFVSNGIVMGSTSPETNDPVMKAPKGSFDTSLYNKIEFRMKHSIESDEGAETGFYFTTSISPDWGESKFIGTSLSGGQKSDGFVTYTLDCRENKMWKGNLVQLRFDPFNNVGTFEIDYIKLIRDPNAKEKADLPIHLINGDAEGDEEAFMSTNGVLTVVSDPVKKDNKVYQISAGHMNKSWLYVVQQVTFKPEMTYNVEFDVKIEGTNDGIKDVAEAVIYVNLKYLDNSGTIDHTTKMKTFSSADGWVHCKEEIKVTNSTDRGSDLFSIYSNPVGEQALEYLIDNVTISEVKK